MHYVRKSLVPVFINDIHTVAVSENSLRVGDIVTYWYVEYENGVIVDYVQCAHSAIVHEIEYDGTIGKKRTESL